MVHFDQVWEANEDAIYAFWDSLDAQERLNWLECYEIMGKTKIMYYPLDEVFGYMAYADMISLSQDLLEEIS